MKSINKNWYKFLTEISQADLDRTKLEQFLSKKSTSQFQEIFGSNLRFSVPILKSDYTPRDLQLLEYIKQIEAKGWTVDLSQPFGYATKVVESKVGDKVYQNKKKVKIGPLIIELGQEAADFWGKNNKFYTSKDNLTYFATAYSMIFSRAPIDILRMSDHDGWTSCHSVRGEYFKCAVGEAVDGGAVVYIARDEDLKTVNLNDKEIFLDPKRSISGIKPISRIRIRKFVDHTSNDSKDNFELGVPEKRVYGTDFSGFYDLVRKVLLEKQSETISKMQEVYGDKLNISTWILIGGTYQDSDPVYLFKPFLENIFTQIVGHADVEPNEAEEEYLNAQLYEKFEGYKESFKKYNINLRLTPEGHGEHTLEVEVEKTINFGNLRDEILSGISSKGGARSIFKDTGNFRDIFWYLEDATVSAGKNDGDIAFEFYFNKNINNIDDLEEFIQELNFFTDTNIQPKDAFLEFFYDLGVLVDSFKETIENLEDDLINFHIQIIHREYIRFFGNYTPLDFNRKEGDIKVDNALRDVDLSFKYSFKMYYESKLSEIKYKIGYELYKIIAKKISDAYLKNNKKFFTNPKLFKESIKLQNKITSDPVDVITYNFSFDNNKVSISFNTGYTRIQEFGSERFLDFVKFIDKNYNKIIDIIRNILLNKYLEAVDDVIEKIEEFKNSGSRTLPKEVYYYPGMNDPRFQQQHLDINENKNSLFKIKGKKWIINNNFFRK